MCIHKGVRWACGHEWQGWDHCNRARKTNQSGKQCPTVIRGKKIFFVVKWCCSPYCCEQKFKEMFGDVQAAMNDQPANSEKKVQSIWNKKARYREVVLAHLTKCVPCFTNELCQVGLGSITNAATGQALSNQQMMKPPEYREEEFNDKQQSGGYKHALSCLDEFKRKMEAVQTRGFRSTTKPRVEQWEAIRDYHLTGNFEAQSVHSSPDSGDVEPVPGPSNRYSEPREGVDHNLWAGAQTEQYWNETFSPMPSREISSRPQSRSESRPQSRTSNHPGRTESMDRHSRPPSRSESVFSALTPRLQSWIMEQPSISLPPVWPSPERRPELMEADSRPSPRSSSRSQAEDREASVFTAYTPGFQRWVEEQPSIWSPQPRSSSGTRTGNALRQPPTGGSRRSDSRPPSRLSHSSTVMTDVGGGTTGARNTPRQPSISRSIHPESRSASRSSQRSTLMTDVGDKTSPVPEQNYYSAAINPATNDPVDREVQSNRLCDIIMEPLSQPRHQPYNELQVELLETAYTELLQQFTARRNLHEVLPAQGYSFFVHRMLFAASIGLINVRICETLDENPPNIAAQRLHRLQSQALDVDARVKASHPILMSWFWAQPADDQLALRAEWWRRRQEAGQ